MVLKEEPNDIIIELIGKLQSNAVHTRQQAAKQLNAYSITQVCNFSLPVLKSASTSVYEKQRICEYLVKRANSSTVGSFDDVQGTVSDILNRSQTLLSSEEPLRASAKRLIASLSRVLGIKKFVSCMGPLFNTCHSDVRCCKISAQCLSICADVHGVTLLMPLFATLAKSDDVINRIIFLETIPYLDFPAVVLSRLLNLVNTLLTDTRINVVNLAAKSLAILIKKTPSSIFNITLFDESKHILTARMHRGNVYILKCLCLIHSYLSNVSRDMCEISQLEDIMTALIQISNADELVSLQICLHCISVLNKNSGQRSWFFNTLYKPTKFVPLLTEIVVSLNIENSELIERIRHGDRLLAVNVIASSPQLLVNNDELEHLIDIITSEIKETFPIQVSSSAALNVAKALRHNLGRSGNPSTNSENLTAIFINNLLQLSKSADIASRERAYEMLSASGEYLSAKQQEFVLMHLSEQLGEEYPNVLGAVIKATERFIICSQTCDGTLVPKLVPILRNRSELVQEPVVDLLKTLALVSGDLVPAREWMNACNELLALQSSPKVRVRHAASATFAKISAVVGPAAVAGSLLVQFKSNNRQIRVTAAAAIASIAAENGTFGVLPLLLYEYSQSNADNVKQSVLKSVQFMSEFCDDIPLYVESLLSFVQFSMLQTSQSYRQTTAAIIERMAQKSKGYDLEPLFVHFLNALMPSIYETSNHVHARVIAAIQKLTTVLGPGVIINYLLAGLFHPARKVRTAYWDAFNAVNATFPITTLVPVQSFDGLEDVRDVW